MTDKFKPCCYCDGEGQVPSNAYFAWHKCPEEYAEKYYKDNPVKLCPHCQGQKELFYIDGEKDRLNSLLDRWEKETSILSSIEVTHPCFVEAKKMKSKEAIGWLLERMKKEATWSMALLHYWVSKKESPITEEMKGKIQVMTDEWVKWGKKKKFIKSE